MIHQNCTYFKIDTNKMTKKKELNKNNDTASHSKESIQKLNCVCFDHIYNKIKTEIATQKK